MERDTINNVWLEVQYDGDSFNLTLLSEAVGRQAKAEAVANLDPETVESGAVFSLNLSDETRSALVENQQSDKSFEEQLKENLMEVHQSQVSEGDVLTDENAPSWSQSDWVEVVEVLSRVRADEYVIQGFHEGEAIDTRQQFTEDKTVADANPSYPSDDAVVIGQYEGTGKHYAFPASRLK